MSRMVRGMALGAAIAASANCNVIGPACLARQQRGTVATVGGEVASGGLSVHLVDYGSDGSQNDVRLTVNGGVVAPDIRVYATRAACTEFRPPPAVNDASCALLGVAGLTAGGIFVNNLIVTNGRGNPDVLGQPAQFKLWVIGDPSRSTRYTFDITWFYGPDC